MRRPLRLLLLVPVVVILAADVWVLANRTRTTEVTREDALAEFRETPEVVPTPARSPRSRPVGSTTTLLQLESEDEHVVVGGTTTSTTSRVAAGSGWDRPADGVYTYDTSGFETLALGGARHDFPPETQAILRYADGCDWQLEHRVIEEHVDTFDSCSSASRQSWYRWRIERTFLNRTLVFDYRCEGETRMLHADRSPGDVFTAHCDTGEGERAEAKFRYVGDVDLEIGGSSIAAAHFTVDVELTGDVEGTVDSNLWIDRASGMRLREERVVDNTVPTPLGRADYHEEATFQLQSMLPAT